MRLRNTISILKWILIIFSLIAFLLINTEALCKMSPDISPQGFKTYLSLYNPFQVLFGSLFVVITADLAIERLGLMSESNKNAALASLNSFKASSRTTWIQTVKEFYSEIRSKDPRICKEITRKSIEIHDYLFAIDYKISDEETLEDFFDRFFSDGVSGFEQMNTVMLNVGFYSDKNQSYSFDSFRYIFFVMINADESYNGIAKDLEAIYKKMVQEFNSDLINADLYEAGIEQYVKNKSAGTQLKPED